MVYRKIYKCKLKILGQNLCFCHKLMASTKFLYWDTFTILLKNVSNPIKQNHVNHEERQTPYSVVHADAYG